MAEDTQNLFPEINEPKFGIKDEDMTPFKVRQFVPGGTEYQLTTLNRYVSLEVFAPTVTVSTGDGAKYFHVPPQLDGMKLVYVHGFHVTAGATSNTTDIQINNTTQSVDMLSTVLSIDYNETDSSTAGTPVVINESNAFIHTNDILRVDVDAVTTVAPTGLMITLGFRKP